MAWATRRRYHQQHPGPEDTHLLIEVSQTSSHFDRTEKLRLYAEAKIAEYWQVDVPNRIVTVHCQPHGEFRYVRSFDESAIPGPPLSFVLVDIELETASESPSRQTTVGDRHFRFTRFLTQCRLMVGRGVE